MLAALRADVIWCVGVKGDHTADKSPEAFARMSAMLAAFAGRPVRVSPCGVSQADRSSSPLMVRSIWCRVASACTLASSWSRK